MAQAKERRFSLDEDFMNYKTDDIFYGFMRSLSTARPVYVNGKQKWEEYLPKKTFQENKEVLKTLIGRSAKTITRKLDSLIAVGLVKEDTFIVDEHEYPCYTFPYDYDGVYKVINLDMLKYLVNTRNNHAIRIYLYLLNCSTMKESYIFTYKEIKKALGYSENTDNDCIRYVLQSFHREGVIKYHKEKFMKADLTGELFAVEEMVLDFIATNPKQLQFVE